MKLITSEVLTYFSSFLITSFLKKLQNAYFNGKKSLMGELKDLEEGKLFSLLGIQNFLEDDYFSWYLDEWDEDLADLIFNMIKKLLNYEPATVELNPDIVRDLFKNLYQNLIPRTIRHKLGEYLTPDWLAELLLDEIGYKGSLRKSILDPACGSGTFLVAVIKRVKDYSEKRFIEKEKTLNFILNNIKGMDLNPLAVQASKANYIIALSGLLRTRSSIKLPIYLSDSIAISQRTTLMTERELYLTTSVGEFKIPYSILKNGNLFKILEIIEIGIKQEDVDSYSSEEFKELLLKKVEIGKENDLRLVLKLYNQIRKLHRQNKNKIWIKLLENSFAPLFIGRFDYVVGNPPWVNWSNLSESFRNRSKKLWNYYGLLEKTKGGGLGKVKKDMAMLFTARCLDRYVKEGGKFAFLIPYTLFKTQAGAGFRKFLKNGLKKENKKIRCNLFKIHDLVELYPFEKATNRTAMFLIKKNKSTNFPIPVKMWKTSLPEIKTIMSLEEVKKKSKTYCLVMKSIKETKPEMPWMSGSLKAIESLKKIIGESPHYTAHAGVYTGLNGAYWINIDKKKNDSFVISNPKRSGQKIDVKIVKKEVEKDLIYPLIRGREVKRWFFNPQTGYIIVPTNRKGENLSPRDLKVNFPKSYDYFLELKEFLEERSVYKLAGEDDIWYGLYINISEYTFKPYKVVWKYIKGKISGKAEFSTAVLEPYKDENFESKKLLLPNEKLMLVAFDEKEEAHYLCAILNSVICQLFVASYVIETAISTHIIKNMLIPEFDNSNPDHLSLSNLSMKAHKLTKIIRKGNKTQQSQDKLNKIEEEINKKTANLYQIDDVEYEEIKNTLNLLLKHESEKKVEEKPTMIDINGIGKKTESKLKEFGIKDLIDLRNCEPSDIAEKINGISEEGLKGWREKAKDILNENS